MPLYATADADITAGTPGATLKPPSRAAAVSTEVCRAAVSAPHLPSRWVSVTTCTSGFSVTSVQVQKESPREVAPSACSLTIHISVHIAAWGFPVAAALAGIHRVVRPAAEHALGVAARDNCATSRRARSRPRSRRTQCHMQI